METITMDSEVFKKLSGEIAEIAKYIRSHTEPETDKWLDNFEVCNILKVSPRKMQRLRSNGQIAYSIIGKSVYYRASNLRKLLEKHLICASNESYRELVQNHSIENKKNDKKRRNTGKDQ